MSWFYMFLYNFPPCFPSTLHSHSHPSPDPLPPSPCRTLRPLPPHHTFTTCPDFIWSPCPPLQSSHFRSLSPTPYPPRPVPGAVPPSSPSLLCPQTPIELCAGQITHTAFCGQIKDVSFHIVVSLPLHRKLTSDETCTALGIQNKLFPFVPVDLEFLASYWPMTGVTLYEVYPIQASRNPSVTSDMSDDF